MIIPAYNAEQFIVEALNSVARQSTPPSQVVVIDDGSTDSTAELVVQWCSENSIRVDLIRQPNRGLPAARNAGIRASSGNWVALLDADDVFECDHLSELSKLIAAHPEAIAAFGDGTLFGNGIEGEKGFSRQKAIDAADSSTSEGEYILRNKLYSSLLSGNYIMPCCLAFNRAAADSIGLFDESLRYIEDKDFLLRLSRLGAFVFVDRITARSRVHGNNITHPRNTLRNLHYDLLVLDKALAHTTALGHFPEDERLTIEEIKKLEMSLAYSASCQGVATFAQAIAALARRDSIWLAMRPKNILRAAYSSLKTRIHNMRC